MKKLTNNLKQIHRKSKLTVPASTARDALSCSCGCLVLISACHRWLSPAFPPRLAGHLEALVGGVQGYKVGMLLLGGSHLDLPGSSSRATRTLLLSCPTLLRQSCSPLSRCLIWFLMPPLRAQATLNGSYRKGLVFPKDANNPPTLRVSCT